MMRKQERYVKEVTVDEEWSFCGMVFSIASVIAFIIVSIAGALLGDTELIKITLWLCAGVTLLGWLISAIVYFSTREVAWVKE